MLDADPFLGRVLTGRIEAGRVAVGDTVKSLIARRQGDRARAADQIAGLSRPQARAGRARRSRRHRRHRRAGRHHGFRHGRRARTGRGDSRPADRSADAFHHRVDQRFPARRARWRQSAEPRHPRSAAARGGKQCRHPRHRDRRARTLRSRRPRRIAIGRADRNHAPRRLRGFDLAPARADPQRERPNARADRGSGDRRRPGIFRHRHREDEPAQSRARRHAPLRRRQDAAGVSTRPRAG